MGISPVLHLPVLSPDNLHDPNQCLASALSLLTGVKVDLDDPAFIGSWKMEDGSERFMPEGHRRRDKGSTEEEGQVVESQAPAPRARSTTLHLCHQK